MAELRKEYADIAVSYEDTPCKHSAIHVATLCQELADRPMKELTDAEIAGIFKDEFGLGAAITHRDVKAGRAIIAAFLKKPHEPTTVKFRAARHKETGIIGMMPASSSLLYHEWADADGKPQEFEVRI